MGWIAMIMVVASDEGYYDRHTSKCLKSLERYAHCEVYFFTVGWKYEYPSKSGKIRSMSMLTSNGSTNNCQAHGAYLALLEDVDDGETIIWLDSDVEQQREAEPEEIAELQQRNTWLASWNARVGDNLFDEAERLRPLRPVSDSRVHPKWDSSYLKSVQCFNTGIMIASKDIFMTLHRDYLRSWLLVDPLFNHHAKMQWNMNLVAYQNNGISVDVLSSRYHVHNKFPFPVGACIEDGSVVLEGKKVLWRHGWTHQSAHLTL